VAVVSQYRLVTFSILLHCSGIQIEANEAKFEIFKYSIINYQFNYQLSKSYIRYGEYIVTVEKVFISEEKDFLAVETLA
jgi:hypothetical protein